MNDKKIILSPQKQQNDTGIEGTNFYLIEDEHSIPIGQVFLRFEDTCVVITWIELMTLYRGQGYLLAVIRNIDEKFPEYQLCLEYDRKREGDYEESIEKLCSVGFEKILSARSKPRRLSYNGERCIFSKNDHLKLCEFQLQFPAYFQVYHFIFQKRKSWFIKLLSSQLQVVSEKWPGIILMEMKWIW